MESFINIDTFKSLIGCVAIVTATVQLIKQYININPILINFIISLVVCIIRIFAIGDLSVTGILMGIINIIPILLSSTGTYEVGKNTANKIKQIKEDK